MIDFNNIQYTSCYILEKTAVITIIFVVIFSTLIFRPTESLCVARDKLKTGASNDVVMKLQTEKPENWEPQKMILLILFTNLLFEWGVLSIINIRISAKQLHNFWGPLLSSSPPPLRHPLLITSFLISPLQIHVVARHHKMKCCDLLLKFRSQVCEFLISHFRECIESGKNGSIEEVITETASVFDIKDSKTFLLVRRYNAFSGTFSCT